MRGQSRQHGRPNENPAKPATAPKRKTKRIRVMATRTGYYDHARRREGDVFDIEESDFSDHERTQTEDGRPCPAGWMKRVPANTELSISTSQDEIDRQHDEILAQRAGQPKADADVI